MTSSHHQQQQRSEARLGSAVCARSLADDDDDDVEKECGLSDEMWRLLPRTCAACFKTPDVETTSNGEAVPDQHSLAPSRLRCCQSISMDDPPLPSIGPPLSTARGSGQRIFCTRFDLQAYFSRRTGQPPGGLVMFGSAHKDGVWESYPAPRPGEMSLRSCLLTAHRNRYLETGTYYHLTSGSAHDKA